MSNDEYDPSFANDVEKISGRPLQLITNKTDAEKAKELKLKIIEAYKPFLEMLNEADKDGFQVQAGVGKDFSGKYVIAQLVIMKQF